MKTIKTLRLPLSVITLLFLSCTDAFPQSIIEDAIALEKCLEKDNPTPTLNGEPACETLTKYAHAAYSEDSLNCQAVGSAFDNNPFLGNNSTLVKFSGSLMRGSDNFKPTLGSVVKSASNLPVTNLADGLARFLVERTKEELNLAVFKKFQKVLDQSDLMEYVFPETKATLDVIGTEIYDYENYIMGLKEAFETDLHDLPRNIIQWLENAKGAKKVDKWLVHSLKVGLGIADRFIKGAHPAEVISSLAHNTDLDYIDPSKNLRNVIRIVDLISGSMRSSNGDRYWISVDQLKSLNESGFHIYLGLIYQQMSNNDVQLSWRNDKKRSIKDLLDALAKDIEQTRVFREHITIIAQEFTAIDAALRSWTKTGSADNQEASGDAQQATLGLLTAPMIDLLDHAVELTDLKFLNLNKPEFHTKWLSITRRSLRIYQQLKARKYAGAILDATILLTDALGDDFEYKGEFLKYGSLMAAIVQAKDPEEVKDAIKAVALPAGSARIKKGSVFNISLNAYVGANLTEFKDPDNLARINGRFGVHAPVGVAFSFGIPLGKDCDFSLSAFISLIDVGGIASYRFSNTDSAIKGDVTLGNLFSPGANFVVGLPKIPVSAGIGYQAMPGLRSISKSGEPITSLNSSVFQMNYFIAVDIPLLNIYNNARRKVRTGK